MQQIAFCPPAKIAAIRFEGARFFSARKSGWRAQSLEASSKSATFAASQPSGRV